MSSPSTRSGVRKQSIAEQVPVATTRSGNTRNTMSTLNGTSGFSSNFIFMNDRPIISREASIRSRSANWPLDSLKKLLDGMFINPADVEERILRHASFRQYPNLNPRLPLSPIFFHIDTES